MKQCLNVSLLLLGIVLLASSIWQFDREKTEGADNSVVDIGNIYWALPPKLLAGFKNSATFLAPSTLLTFNLTTTYPADTYTGNGFRILLKSKLRKISFSNEDIPFDSKRATEIRAKVEKGSHSFTLDLPGLAFSPSEPNKLGIDGKAHWQVGPPKEAGIYKGYIRISEGFADSIGAEYSVKWGNIQEMELEIRIKKSFLFLEKVETLMLGFLGSLLTVPAIIMIYEKYRHKDSN